MKLRNLLVRPYRHTNSKGVKYYLTMKRVSLRGGELVPIYFFIKSRYPNKNQGDLQQRILKGCRVSENPRNGFLTIIKE